MPVVEQLALKAASASHLSYRVLPPAWKGPPRGLVHVQMPEEERGHKQLGRGHALSHLAQLGLTLLLGILVMAEPWPTVSAWRAVYGGFGVLYALQVSHSLKHVQ